MSLTCAPLFIIEECHDHQEGFYEQTKRAASFKIRCQTSPAPNGFMFKPIHWRLYVFLILIKVINAVGPFGKGVINRV